MTPTSASTNTKYDIEDGGVPKEKLKISLVVSPGQNWEGEKRSGDGPEEPTEVVVKDLDPPDGGYGWVVVAYIPGEIGVNGRAFCILNAFTWGINAVCPTFPSQIDNRLTEYIFRIISIPMYVFYLFN